MKFYTYELLDDPEYVNEYCVRLSDKSIWHRTHEEDQLVDAMVKDATANFKAYSLGDRLFFETNEERQACMCWLELRWA